MDMRKLERQAVAARKKSDELILQATALLLQAARVRKEVRDVLSLEMQKVETQMRFEKSLGFFGAEG